MPWFVGSTGGSCSMFGFQLRCNLLVRLPTHGCLHHAQRTHPAPFLLAASPLQQEEFINGSALRLECSCRGDLALRHRDCVMKWVQVKGSNVSATPCRGGPKWGSVCTCLCAVLCRRGSWVCRLHRMACPRGLCCWQPIIPHHLTVTPPEWGLRSLATSCKDRCQTLACRCVSCASRRFATSRRRRRAPPTRTYQPLTRRTSMVGAAAPLSRWSGLWGKRGSQLALHRCLLVGCANPAWAQWVHATPLAAR